MSEAQRLKALEEENRKLKRLVADYALDKVALKDLLSKKWVSPQTKRTAMCELISTEGLSQRKAYKLLNNKGLKNKIVSIAREREGLHKRVYRLYRETGLKVRRRGGRKRGLRSRLTTEVLNQANQRWSLDFVSDALADGRRLRILTIVDDFTRECLKMVVDTSISGIRVSRELSDLLTKRGAPNVILSDNGTEFTSNAILKWSRENPVSWQYIQPGNPCKWSH